MIASCPTSIAVLAGGQSRRMGIDKALLRLLPEDPTLLQGVLDRVRPLSGDLFVVATNRPAYAQFGAPVHADLYPGTGVLGGIASALRHAKEERCLVLSCDHPFLNPLLLQAMLARAGEWDALVPVLPGESRQGGTRVRQTLHAVYSKCCLPAIERALTGGRLQAVSFLSEVHVEECGVDEIVTLDSDLRSFFSVNTPESLEQASLWRIGG